jgi:hypothetical protein
MRQFLLQNCAFRKLCYYFGMITSSGQESIHNQLGMLAPVATIDRQLQAAASLRIHAEEYYLFASEDARWNENYVFRLEQEPEHLIRDQIQFSAYGVIACSEHFHETVSNRPVVVRDNALSLRHIAAYAHHTAQARDMLKSAAWSLIDSINQRIII